MTPSEAMIRGAPASRCLSHGRPTGTMVHNEDDFPASHSRLRPARHHRYRSRRSPYPWSGQACPPRRHRDHRPHRHRPRRGCRAVDAGVVAVVNLAPSVSGRYPNLGPGLLDRRRRDLDRSGRHRRVHPDQRRRAGADRRRQHVQRRALGRLRRAADRRLGRAGARGVQGRHGQPARGVQRQRDRAPAARAGAAPRR